MLNLNGNQKKPGLSTIKIQLLKLEFDSQSPQTPLSLVLKLGQSTQLLSTPIPPLPQITLNERFTFNCTGETTLILLFRSRTGREQARAEVPVKTGSSKESCACIYGVDSALLGFVFYRVRKQTNQQKENLRDKQIDNSQTFHTYFFNKANEDKSQGKVAWTFKEPVQKKKTHRASQQLFSSCLKGDLSHQTFKPKSIKQNRYSTHSIVDALQTEHSQLKVKLVEAEERQQQRIKALAQRIEQELSQLTAAFKVERQILQRRIKRQQDCFYIRSKCSKSL